MSHVLTISVHAAFLHDVEPKSVTASEVGNKIEPIIANMIANSYPHEKVYLHLDNNSYYFGDYIWFNAYLVNADGNTIPPISNTLYVELLNPGGEVIDKKVLKVENGRAHGDFILNRVPFYSGFYEVRAYTKYMLNFGDETVFSRIIPIFEKPETEGDYKSRELRKYGTGKFKQLRKKPHKGSKINLQFYPEGGNLINGVPSQVAFEATDKFGNPLDVSGTIVDDNGNTITSFHTSHEGKGRFPFLSSAHPAKAQVEYDGKIHTFKLPEALDSGYVMTVNNISSPDSVCITVNRSGNSLERDTLGIVLLSQGCLKNYVIASTHFSRPLEIKFDKSTLPTGVAEIVLLNKAGQPIADRMIFNHGKSDANISVTTAFDKPYYAPYEPVTLSCSLKEADGTPVTSPFSISIRDDENELVYQRNILTDLLLISDIKGYVANPTYYFETDDSTRRNDLDILLMVQGWHRYAIDKMTEPRKQLRYNPETTGIETVGIVNAHNLNKPKSGVDISAFLLLSNQSEEKYASAMQVLTTDSLGKFSFIADVTGNWNLILSAREKGKKKNYLISLDRRFSPQPRRYRYTDMEITAKDGPASQPESHLETESDSIAEMDLSEIMKAIDDSLASAGVKPDKVEHLGEVVVKGKKNSKAREIYEAHSKSIAYYDVKSGLDDIRDDGEYIGDDIHTFLRKMNNNFVPIYSNGEEYLHYKQRMPLFVINYQRTNRTKMDYDRYKNIRLEAIKSIYISENIPTMLKYADPMITMIDIDKIYGCAVFIETYPDGEIPVDAGKGVRKTRLQGYTTPDEFYNPDYSIMEPEPDYRRTLYWNPSVTPDINGEATVKFYNNSSCKSFTVDLQTVTPAGSIGSSL